MKLLSKASAFLSVFLVFLSNATNSFAAAINVSCLDNNGDIGVNTAFGCVPVELNKFIAWLLPYLFGIGGGIAFILIIVGFIQMTTSNGDPKAVQGAKETITSAIVGLLICLFAIFLLRLIAVDILHIPGIS
jgi:hypothetical protein